MLFSLRLSEVHSAAVYRQWLSSCRVAGIDAGIEGALNADGPTRNGGVLALMQGVLLRRDDRHPEQLRKVKRWQSNDFSCPCLPRLTSQVLIFLRGSLATFICIDGALVHFKSLD